MASSEAIFLIAIKSIFHSLNITNWYTKLDRYNELLSSTSVVHLLIKYEYPRDIAHLQ